MSEPHEIVPAFVPDRLRVLARILIKTRKSALPDHRPSVGDTNWGLGTRVYERTCHAITKAAARYSWLTVLDPDLHFVFKIDGVPVRFGRGDPDDPNPRLLHRKPDEEKAQQLAFEFANDPGLVDWRWRLIIETDSETLDALRVVLVQVSADGIVKQKWQISVPPEFLVREDDEVGPPEPVELPSPQVRAKRPGRDKSSA